MLHRKTDEIFGKGLSNLESLLVWIGQEKYNFVRVVAVRLKAFISLKTYLNHIHLLGLVDIRRMTMFCGCVNVIMLRMYH